MAPRNLAVGDLFRLADQFHDSALLHFAHHCGLFERTTEPLPAQRVADLMHWVPRKAEVLLNALVAIGLLAKDPRGRYRNAPVVDEALVRSRPAYIGGVVEHQRLQWDSWSRIDAVLASTTGLDWQQEHRLERDPAANQAFHEAMRNLARANLPAFLALPLPRGALHVIDMAGSHGSYLAALAQRDPALTGEVWDLPGAREPALRTFREAGCADRCSFRIKDLTAASSFAGPRADVVMLNDCLHYFEPETAAEILARAADLLKPGGTVVVATQLLDADGVSPPAAAGFSMHMVLNSAHGGLHPTPWIVERLVHRGLQVSQHPLDPTGRYVILLGQLLPGSERAPVFPQ